MVLAATMFPLAAAHAQDRAPPPGEARDYLGVRFVSVRALIGEVVSDPTGQRIGRVGDVAIDLDTGRAHYAELVPFVGQPQWLPLADLAGRHGRPGFRVDTTAARLAARNASSGGSARLEKAFRASALLDRPVEDRDGRRVGQLEELVVDQQSGAVRYVVVRFEPGVLAKNQLLDFDTELLTARRVDGRPRLSLNLDGADLAGRTGYVMGQWEGRSSPEYWLRRQ